MIEETDSKITSIEPPTVTLDDIISDDRYRNPQFDEIDEDTLEAVVEEINESLQIVSDYITEWMLHKDGTATYSIRDTTPWIDPIIEVLENSDNMDTEVLSDDEMWNCASTLLYAGLSGYRHDGHTYVIKAKNVEVE